MTKPVLNPANNGHSKGSKLYDHSITTNNALPKYQQPNHYGFPPALDHNKSSRLEYQQDSQELRIATIAALSQQIKSKNLLWSNRVFYTLVDTMFDKTNFELNIYLYSKQ